MGGEGEEFHFRRIGNRPRTWLFIGGEDSDSKALCNGVDRLIGEGGETTVAGGFVLHGEIGVGMDADIAPCFAEIYTLVVGKGGGFQKETLAGGRFDGIATDEVALFVDAGDINVLIDRCGLRNDGHKAECDEAEKAD